MQRKADEYKFLIHVIITMHTKKLFNTTILDRLRKLYSECQIWNIIFLSRI